MKIAVHASGVPSFTLRLPTTLVLNPFFLRSGLSYTGKNGKEMHLNIPPEAVKPLCKELKKYRGLTLVSVRSADGDTVEIVL